MNDEFVVLIKACSSLRLTRQIRLATFMAQTERKRLLLSVRAACVLADELQAFVAEHAHLIEVRRS